MKPRPLKILLYGEPGTGKSSLASTFPKPLLVMNSDGLGKELPYLEHGEIGLDTDDATEVISRKTGKLLIRVEHYHDDFGNMTKNSAHNKLFDRLKKFHLEYGKWASVCFDSMSSFELAFRKWDEYVANAGAMNPMQFYAASSHDLEDVFCWRAPRWPMNVIAIAHIEKVEREDKPGHFVHVGNKPAAPGKVGEYKNSSAFTEIYRTHYKMEMVNGTVQAVFRVQTQPQKMYPACTRIHAPDGVVSHYRNLWPQAASSEGDDSPTATGEKGSNPESGKDRGERTSSVEKGSKGTDSK